MNMQINRFNNNPLEPLPAEKLLASTAARPAGASNSTATELTPLDAINAQAGIKEGLSYHKKSLHQRRLAPARTQPPNRSNLTKKPRINVNNRDDMDEDEPHLFPVSDTLDLLREDSGREQRAEVEARLAQHFDPMQRYNVLFDALQDVEQQPVSKHKKNSIKNALNEMMSDLMERYPHELRKALQETDDLVVSLEAMAADEHGHGKLPSTRELRFLIGAKSKGNFDAPLTPLTMLKALIKNFGAENCMQVTRSLRSRMMSGL